MFPTHLQAQHPGVLFLSNNLHPSHELQQLEHRMGELGNISLNPTHQLLAEAVYLRGRFHLPPEALVDPERRRFRDHSSFSQLPNSTLKFRRKDMSLTKAI